MTLLLNMVHSPHTRSVHVRDPRTTPRRNVDSRCRSIPRAVCLCWSVSACLGHAAAHRCWSAGQSLPTIRAESAALDGTLLGRRKQVRWEFVQHGGSLGELLADLLRHHTPFLFKFSLFSHPKCSSVRIRYHRRVDDVKTLPATSKRYENSEFDPRGIPDEYSSNTRSGNDSGSLRDD